MSFSLYHVEGSVPVGRVNWKGSTLHGKIIYVSERLPGKVERKADIPRELRALPDDDLDAQERAVIGYGGQKPLDVLGVDYFKRSDHGRNMRKGDLAIMNEALEEDAPDLSEYIELGERPEVKNYMEQKLADAKLELATRKRDFKLGAGTVVPVIDSTKERECVFIIGASGQGKSRYARMLIDDYLRVHPDNPVFILSKITNDPAFAGLEEPKVNFTPLDEKFIQSVNSGRAAQIANCMVVFDDVDTISDKKLLNAIWKLRADLLQTGRHGNAYVVNTSHVFRGGKQTKEANMESSSFVIFPKSGDHYHMKDYLKTYGGKTPAQIDRIMRTNSNWVKISRTRPHYVLHEHGGYFLDYEPIRRSSEQLRAVKKQRTDLFDYDD